MKHQAARFEKIFLDIQTTAKLLWERGWAEKSAGNLSVAVPAAGGAEKTGKTLLWVSASGARFRDIAKNPEENLLLLEVSQGKVKVLLGRKPLSPTSELPAHLLVHEALRKAGWPEKAVLHTHPTELLALTHLSAFCDFRRINRTLWSMLPEVRMYVPEGAAFLPYRPSGSRALGRLTADAAQKGYRVMLWEKHGAVSLGESAQEAFDHLDVLNKAAIVYFTAAAGGQKPKGLSKKALSGIARAFPSRLRGKSAV